jgi:hypothetical protein
VDPRGSGLDHEQAADGLEACRIRAGNSGNLPRSSTRRSSTPPVTARAGARAPLVRRSALGLVPGLHCIPVTQSRAKRLVQLERRLSAR